MLNPLNRKDDKQGKNGKKSCQHAKVPIPNAGHAKDLNDELNDDVGDEKDEKGL